jgi:uncharacterized protein (TIGR02246 family)
MFERYTEKARRVIFFARYEASQYGSHCIDTEHLLLALMREDFALMSSVIGSGNSPDTVRQEVEKQIQRGERFSTAVEVPLSVESERVLSFAAQEAERFAEQHVGTKHLLLALLREKNSRAAVILRQHGAHEAKVRQKLTDGTDIYRKPSTPANNAMDTLSRFLSDLTSNTSSELADFFTENGQFIDTSGKIWFGRAEIKKEFERLFAAYAKKNTTYRIEKTVSERQKAVLVSVLWENAMHTDQTPRSVLRMTVVLVPEGDEWIILLAQVVPVAP